MPGFPTALAGPRRPTRGANAVVTGLQTYFTETSPPMGAGSPRLNEGETTATENNWCCPPRGMDWEQPCRKATRIGPGTQHSTAKTQDFDQPFVLMAAGQTPTGPRGFSPARTSAVSRRHRRPPC